MRTTVKVKDYEEAQKVVAYLEEMGCKPYDAWVTREEWYNGIEESLESGVWYNDATMHWMYVNDHTYTDRVITVEELFNLC